MIIKYIADDGTTFDTKKECLWHEYSYLLEGLKPIKEFCTEQDCEDCPFSEKQKCFFKNLPINWNL